jgi:hypothetical protein
MVQYHALQLLHRIKQHDKLAVSKIISAVAKQSGVRGPMAHVQQNRIAAQTMKGLATTTPLFTDLFKFLVESLHNTNAMVMFEAARALSRCDQLSAVQLAPAIVGMKSFGFVALQCSSSLMDFRSALLPFLSQTPITRFQCCKSSCHRRCQCSASVL